MASAPPEPTATLYEQASHWVSLLHNGVCTTAQLRVFQDWLARSPAHKQAYQEVEAFWQQLGGLEAIAQPRLEAARAYAGNAQQERRRLPRQTLALAASVLLIVLAVPLARLQRFGRKTSISY